MTIQFREFKIARIKGKKKWKEFVYLPDFVGWVEKGRSTILYSKNAIEIQHDLN